MSKDLYKDIPDKWFELQQENDKWVIYNPEGKKAQEFTIEYHGSAEAAEQEARRTFAERNRRLKRLRQ